MLNACRLALLAAIVAASNAYASEHSAPVVSEDTLRWRRALEAERAATHAPGAAMVVVQGGRIVYATAVGVRNAETLGFSVPRLA